MWARMNTMGTVLLIMGPLIALNISLGAMMSAGTEPNIDYQPTVEIETIEHSATDDPQR